MNEILQTQARKAYSDRLNQILLDHRAEMNNLKAQLLALSALILALSQL